MTQIDDPKIDWLGKRVFCRLDLNVPMDANGHITDDSRVKASLDTVSYLLGKGARLVVASHLGRPKGKARAELSLEPVAARLQGYLDREVIFAHDCIGDGIKRLISELKPGSLLMLENLRFHSSEEKNDESFARLLAQSIDVYVNDAFGAAHRAHASVDAITRFVPIKCIGFQFQKEIEQLSYLMRSPQKPFVAILGGAKVGDKIGALTQLLNKIDTLIIGGAMAYTFLKAKGQDIGKSRFEEDKLQIASMILQKASSLGVQVILPVDHIAVNEFAEDATAHPVQQTIPEDMFGIDIGSKTLSECERAIHFAKTIFWNGPMGVFEWESGFAGTLGIAKAIAESSALSVVGGGDTLAALAKAKINSESIQISTGGGASLEYIQGLELPALSSLSK
ncbi:MAG: phosphoglycerate kinase [Myxococcota bacterium]